MGDDGEGEVFGGDGMMDAVASALGLELEPVEEQEEGADAEQESIKVNGRDYTVPKDVAAQIAQGRRFQSDKDRLEQHTQRQQMELETMRQQMALLQQQMQQQQAQMQRPAPGPSPLEQAFKQADEAIAGRGVLSELGPLVDKVIQSRTAEQNQKIDQVLQAFKEQQDRLKALDQQTHASSLMQQAMDGLAYRQQEDGVTLTLEQQQEVVSNFMAAQQASGYNRDQNVMQGQFLTAYYKALYDGVKARVEEPSALGRQSAFTTRPPVGAPITPGKGLGAGFRKSSRPPQETSTVDLLRGGM